MVDLVTFRFNGVTRRLIHAAEITGGGHWGSAPAALLCDRRRRAFGVWDHTPEATTENVTCPRCLSALRRVEAAA